MATFTVTFDGTRLTEANTTTGWTSNTTTPTLETDFYYQGGSSISGKVKTSESGFYFTSASTNMAVPNVALSKILATNKDVLDGRGYIMRIGSTSANWVEYANVFTSTTYPIAGGWQAVLIDPTVSQWRTGNGGTPDLTTVTYWEYRGDFSVLSKSENFVVDAIDIFSSGAGLTGVGGDGANVDGTFEDFRSTDEGNSSNRWAVVQSRGGILYVNGVLTVGNSGAITEFTDSNRVLVFPQHYVGNGAVGTNFDISNANTILSVTSCVFNGRGSFSSPDDTRPRYIVLGNSGSLTFDATSFNTFENMFLNANVTFSGCSFIGGNRIYLNSAIISGSAFSNPTAGNGNAYVETANLSKITTSEFTANSTAGGHAIELTATGTFSWTNDFFSYGATGTGNAVIFNNSGGNVTINVGSGYSSPTYLNGTGANTVIVAGQVTLTVSGLVTDTEVRIFRQDTNEELAGTDSSSTTFDYTYTYDAPNANVYVVVLHTDYLYQRIAYELQNSDQTLPIQLATDRVYSNPA